MAVEAEARGSEWFYPEGRAPPFSAGPGAPGSSSPAMAFTFAAFCYMLALLLTAALIFFAIWHVSSRGRRGKEGERRRSLLHSGPAAERGGGPRRPARARTWPGCRGRGRGAARSRARGPSGGPGVRGSRCPRRRARAQAALRYPPAGLGGADGRRRVCAGLPASSIGEDAQCAPSGHSSA